MNISRPSFALLLLCIAGALAISLRLWWMASRSSAIAFLPHRQPAEWIVYPSPPAPGVHQGLELDSRFHRDFAIKEVPSNAVLSVCAFKRCSIILNDVSVSLPNSPQGNWKKPLAIEVARLLREGPNRIEVIAHRCLPTARAVSSSPEPVSH